MPIHNSRPTFISVLPCVCSQSSDTATCVGHLFRAESLNRIDRGSSLRRDDAGEDRAESEGQYTSDKDQRIPTTDLVQLGSDQAGTSNRSRNADKQSDEDLQEGSAQ